MKNYALLNKLDDKLIPIDNNYNKALVAVETCVAIDEAKDWQDKMAALAYYHKQAGDKMLENYAKRIRHYAQRRMGQILEQYNAKGKRNDLQPTNSKDGKLSQKEVAQSIGLSQRQQEEAVRFANVPQETFKEIVESENIPTKAEIAKLGTKTQVKVIKKSHKAIPFLNAFKELNKIAKKEDAIYMLEIMDDSQKQETLKLIKSMQNWFDTFVVNCNTQ